MQRTETGNMIIMTLAHARATGDGSLIYNYVCLQHIAELCVNSILLVSSAQDMGRFLGEQYKPDAEYRVSNRFLLNIPV